MQQAKDFLIFASACPEKLHLNFCYDINCRNSARKEAPLPTMFCLQACTLKEMLAGSSCKIIVQMQKYSCVVAGAEKSSLLWKNYTATNQRPKLVQAAGIFIGGKIKTTVLRYLFGNNNGNFHDMPSNIN